MPSHLGWNFGNERTYYTIPSSVKISWKLQALMHKKVQNCRIRERTELTVFVRIKPNKEYSLALMQLDLNSLIELQMKFQRFHYQ